MRKRNLITVVFAKQNKNDDKQNLQKPDISIKAILFGSGETIYGGKGEIKKQKTCLLQQ